MEAKVVANTSEGIEFNYKEENEAGTDEHEHEVDDVAGGNGFNPHIWLDHACKASGRQDPRCNG
ncbi:MAG TPA: hypothetical protein VE521_01605 [Nitrososphaera sp.]|jgi:ABC-type Zn uptake system ZnuABC Zn-binding protein ZnuA|nr:hypothetical protein [Nitrososphaera sp.]